MVETRLAAETSAVPLCTSLEEACRRFSSRPAITFGGTTITYQALWQRVTALAGGYERLGVGRGDRILCQLRNCPEHVIAIAAAWARGAAHVGADNDLTGSELARLVDRLSAAALVFEPAQDRADGLAPLRTVAEAAPGTPLVVHAPTPGDAHHSLESLTATGHAVPPDLPSPLDPAHVFLTSGTTGEAKAVVEPLAAHWAKMQFFADAFLPGPDDVHLLYLPMAHVFGSRLALLALLSGGRLVLLERFSPERALSAVRQERVTVLPAVPMHLRLLRDRFDPVRHDVASLRWVVSAAASLPRSLAAWVYEALRAEIMVVYGCSEGFTTLTTDRDEILAGSVGRTVFRGPPGTSADGTVWIESQAAPSHSGKVGEIVYGAATPVRYWDHPDAATDGAFRTGDLGCIDGDGRLHVVGRLKELINRGGLHVSAAEVETALSRHPAIDDAGVIAVPNPVLGEAVCACVTGEHPPDLGSLRGFLGDTLARHKLPDELCVVEDIPRTDIGKVDRRALTSLIIDGAAPRERVRPP